VKDNLGHGATPPGAGDPHQRRVVRLSLAGELDLTREREVREDHLIHDEAVLYVHPKEAVAAVMRVLALIR
jgi:hypothetical protein